MQGLKIEFDPAKDASNIAKRGLTLALGAVILRNAIARIVDDRHDYGETRMIGYGRVGVRLYVCVYTMRGSTHRIISVRKASRKEQRQWPPSA